MQTSVIRVKILQKDMLVYFNNASLYSWHLYHENNRFELIYEWSWYSEIYIHIRYLRTYQTIKGLNFSTAWLLCVTYLKSHVMIKIFIYNLQIKQNLISLFCRHFSIWYGSMRVIILIEFFPESKLKWFHSLTRSIASFHLLAV